MKKPVVLWVVVAVVAAVLGLVAVLVGRTLGVPLPEPIGEPADAKCLQCRPAEEMAARLAGALRFRTISSRDPQRVDTGEFEALHAYLEASFPLVHSTLRREVVGGHSLLYTWEGTDAQAPPLLLLGHLDVVPVDSQSAARWTYPAFDGRIEDGFVWGRGAMDDKQAVTGILEAVESLLGAGFRPKQTLYLAFGHDEEVGGDRGAQKIAALLESRGVQAEFALDEGLLIVKGIMPGVKRPVALVGLTEKGIVSVELVARAPGGHASMPSRETAVGILGAAVAALEKEQMPSRLVAPVRKMFAYVAPEMGFPLKLIFSNLWLFDGLVRAQLSAKPSTHAQIRTTTAPTMLAGSVQENVLANEARAVVNFRILPGDSVQSVLEHVRAAVADTRVEIAIYDAPVSEPSPVSSVDGPGFQRLQKTVARVFPEASLAPSMVVGASDSRLYTQVAKDIYRFMPIVATQDDLERIHGVDERLFVANYERIVRFYIELIRD